MSNKNKHNTFVNYFLDSELFSAYTGLFTILPICET